MRPCLLMLPGLDGSGEMFQPLVGLLGEHFEIVVGRYPDLPDFDAYVDYAASLLPAAGPVSLIAESFAGPVAIALLARLPGRIEAAVLSATFAISPRPLLTGLAGLLPDSWRPGPALRRFTVDLFGINGGDYATAREMALRITAQTDPAVMRRRAAILHRVDVRELLPTIDTPVLCLRASRDRVVPTEHGDMLADGLRNARLVDIDAPHLLLQCRPRESAELIVRHLAAGG